MQRSIISRGFWSSPPKCIILLQFWPLVQCYLACAVSEPGPWHALPCGCHTEPLTVYCMFDYSLSRLRAFQSWPVQSDKKIAWPISFLLRDYGSTAAVSILSRAHACMSLCLSSTITLCISFSVYVCTVVSLYKVTKKMDISFGMLNCHRDLAMISLCNLHEQYNLGLFF